MTETPVEQTALTHAVLTAAVIAKVIADDIKDVRDRTNDKAKKVLAVGQTEKAKINGEEVGTVTYTEGTKTPVIADPAEWLAWVQENAADEITTETVLVGDKAAVAAILKQHPELFETRTIVRPEFEKRTLSAIKKTEAGIVDTDTGQFPQGLDITQGDPKITVRNSAQAQKDALKAVRQTEGYKKVVRNLLEV
jgi:hypothetical protein